MIKLTNNVLLALIFTIGFHLNSNAQTTNVTFGRTHKDPSKTSISKILGQNESGFYTIRSQRASLFNYSGNKYLEFYDNELNLVKSSPITLPNKDLEVEHFLYQNNTIHLFLSLYNKQTHTHYLYGTTVSHDGIVDNKMIEIRSYTDEDNRKTGTFDISFSSDEKSFLVTYHPAYKKNELEKVNYIVIDLSYKTIHDIKIELPYRDKNFAFSDYVLDSKGNIHFLARIDKETKERRSSAFERKIYSYFQDTDEFKEHIVDFGENYISDIMIKVGESDQLICSGFYSDKNANRMKGIFYMEINIDTKSLTVKKTKDFTKEFLSQFMSERKASKGKELYNFEIRDIIIKENGGIMLLAEYYAMQISTSTDPNTGRTRTIYHYYYNDLLIADIAGDGKINWWTRIPKRQHSVNDGGFISGFAYAVNNDKLYIVYNDHPKNMNELDPDKLRNGITKNAMTVLVTVSVDGEISKTPLFSAKENRTFIRPKIHLQSSPNELIIFASRIKDYRFARLKFE